MELEAMKQNEFSSVRSLLGMIRVAMGDRGLVGIAWDGDTLRVTHAIPESGKRMFVMTFDNPMEDYSAETNALIFEFAKQSAVHFGDYTAVKE
jgi:hypothetical protein